MTNSGEDSELSVAVDKTFEYPSSAANHHFKVVQATFGVAMYNSLKRWER